MNPIHTHTYDKELENVKIELKECFESVEKVSSVKKQEAFQELKEYLCSRITEVEMGFLEKLVSEKDKYYDPVNDLRVDNLLYLCYKKLVVGDNTDFLINFRQQLSDLRTGSCVQGRSIRLLQLLYAFE